MIGDRWNLLIVRQLLIGPARFGELSDGLSGIASNLLTNRLRDLESNGIVERRLANDANAITYALTDWGSQLREPINALIRWSTPLMIRGPEGDEFRPDGLLVALPALFADRAPTDHTVAVGICVDDEMIQLRGTPDGVDVTWPDGRELDAVLTADGPFVLGMAAGVLALDDIVPLVGIQGDQSALRNFFDTPVSTVDTHFLKETLA